MGGTHQVFGRSEKEYGSWPVGPGCRERQGGAGGAMQAVERTADYLGRHNTQEGSEHRSDMLV